MTNIEIIKLNAKGQIVIPKDLRTDLNAGDEFVIIREDDHIILKKANDVTDEMKENIEFAKRTEEAYKRHEQGYYKSMDAEIFLQQLKKW